MPQKSWSAKRERQYQHIKEGLIQEGPSEQEAEEIAARTVNKERARAGEAKQASSTSTEDISSGRRGGLQSHSGRGGRTYKQLYAEAQKKGLKGRSKLNKAELEVIRAGLTPARRDAQPTDPAQRLRWSKVFSSIATA